MIESANKDFSQNITADKIWNELIDEDVELAQNMINVCMNIFLSFFLISISWTLHILFPHCHDFWTYSWSKLHLQDFSSEWNEFCVSEIKV